MTPRAARALPFVVMIGAGAAWGATQPLTKVAVSTGYGHFGLVFWQMTVVALVLGPLCAVLGKRLPRGRVQWAFCVLIALIGTILPNSASYRAAVHLPSGVLSILLSLVPLLAFPVALGLGLENFRWRRFAGLMLGLCAVLLLVAPEASLPDRAMVWWIPVALIAAAFYAVEGNVVGRWGTGGLDPVELIFGAALVGSFLSAPLALATGQFIVPPWPLGTPDLALVASAMLHGMAYCSYVWLVQRAGPVFAVQISYFVTLFGVTWAMLFLDERYTGWIWAALVLMLVGIALVLPRRGADTETSAAPAQ